jgi:hypothetical protein
MHTITILHQHNNNSTDAADDARSVAVDEKGTVFLAGSTRGSFPGRPPSNSIHTFVIELEGYTGKVACTRQVHYIYLHILYIYCTHLP